MLEHIKDFLSIHSKEKKGLFVLSLLLFLLVCANLFSDVFLAKNLILVENKKDQIEKWLASNQAAVGEINSSQTTPKKINFSNSVQTQKFFFDPNTASEEELILLGFSKFSIKNILNYRKQNRKFNSPTDLKKVYGVSEQFYNSISEYIRIAESTNTNSNTINQVSKPEKINVNIADSLTLIKLYGIGPKLASRIIKYREGLGGFVSVLQLKEVYGITEEIFNSFENKIYCEGSIQQIDINKISLQDLNKHPYFSRNQANGLINFRIKHGNFKSLEDILSSDLFTEDIAKKIAPYINYND